MIATATELLEARHFPGVVALVSDALDHEPECVPLLLLRARARIALRRDLDAQADLRDIIRLDPQCGTAYRLLGELAARRDENDSAAIFFREALRLDTGDREAEDWLAIVEISSRPAAAAQILPAPAAAAGRFPPAKGPIDRPSTQGGRSLSSPARSSNEERHRREGEPRLARGTQPPHTASDERPTRPRGAKLAVGSEPKLTPVPRPKSEPPVAERISTIPGAQPLRRGMSPSRPMTRGPLPELPGFGEYLVTSGILTRERLRAAQAYQRSMKVQLSTAIVTLGLATPQRIEWAAVAHQSQLARDRG